MQFIPGIPHLLSTLIQKFALTMPDSCTGQTGHWSCQVGIQCLLITSFYTGHSLAKNILINDLVDSGIDIFYSIFLFKQANPDSPNKLSLNYANLNKYHKWVNQVNIILCDFGLYSFALSGLNDQLVAWVTVLGQGTLIFLFIFLLVWSI